MLFEQIKIEGLKGVGTVELELDKAQSVCVLIGENGVGKTKTLEALFQALLIGYAELPSNPMGFNVDWHFSEIQLNQDKIATSKIKYIAGVREENTTLLKHSYPLIFLASQNRGHIQHQTQNQLQNTPPMGTYEQRREAYLSRLIGGMDTNFASLNMDISIEEWFVTIAQSSNAYQKKADNREVELKTVLNLLNKIDARIDPDPNSIEITGDNRVSLSIEGQKRELSHLSTGFASILKIIQSIVSGYGYFTNENQLQNVRGIVLIDEIESHMHLGWQAKIVPLLKQLFPHTTFYITTHSSIVLSQLKTGEAYRLQRDADGVVRNRAITAPNKVAFIDVLKDAFDIDLNQMKVDRMNPDDQREAKRQLLEFIHREEA